MGNNNNISPEKSTKIQEAKQECNIDTIKSKYILKQISEFMEKKTILKIIKNNKNMQNRLEININDYIECSEIYSNIEIEIIPKKKEYGIFININKDEESYYHIYFNNNKNEIKKNDITRNDKVKKIRITIDHQVKSFHKLFKQCKCIELLIFKKFYRNNVIDMSEMFFDCKSLKILNLSNFNTYRVTNMEKMFMNCSSLKELDLSSFDTRNVTDMSYMFSNCKKLERLKIDNFNTKNVRYMSSMFENCYSINYIPVYNFNTDNVSYMSNMFSYCTSLKDIVISNFNFDKINNYDSMFNGCSEELINKIQILYKNIEYKAFQDDILEFVTCPPLFNGEIFY